MFTFLAVSEIIVCAGASASTFYLAWRRSAPKTWLTIYARDDERDLASLRMLYGYNEHTYVAVSEHSQVWRDRWLRGAVSYIERGNVWLVTGEPLADDENLYQITENFISHARENRKLAVFVPTSERFARAVSTQDVRIHKIGTSPYFDLQNWNPRGNSAKGLRLGLNRARRAGIVVESVSDITADFRGEVGELCENWMDGRPAGLEFGWLFQLAPFENANAKRYFAARNTEGLLVGLLAACPIPARDGWYLEDVLKRADAPTGTADLIVFEALRGLAAEGALLATLGTIPLSETGGDDITSGGYILARVLDLTKRSLKSIYNVEGLRCFKSKFVPSWWESEYVVVSKGFLRAPRTGIAVLRVIFGDGSFGLSWVYSSIKKAIRSRRRSPSNTAPEFSPAIGVENSLNQTSNHVVKLG